MQSRTLRLIGLQVEMVEIFPGWSFLVILRVDRVESIKSLSLRCFCTNRFRMMEPREVVMVPRLRGQDLLFGGAETLDFAPPSNKISDYWGGSCPPCPPYNYLTASFAMKSFIAG